MNLKLAAVIFVLTATILLSLHGNRMVFTNDEGILLEPAQRLAGGAAPYVDFFGYMSPGSYWLQAGIFRHMGISLWAGRLPVILGFALQCAMVFWLTARLSSKAPAIAVVLAFAGFQVADPGFLTAQHRWDSATLALAGLCLIVAAQGRRSPAWWWASGALMGAAAWCTPSVGLLTLTTTAWMAARKEQRNRLIHFAGGIALAGAAGLVLLATEGALKAFVGQMAWLRSNYAADNVMSYGSLIGGLGAAIKGAHGLAKATLLTVLTCVELPAILPPAALGLWGLAAWRGKIRAGDGGIVALLLLSMTALVLTAFPRADVMHLAFVAALPYALTVAAAARLIPPRVGAWVAMAALVFPVLFAANYWNGWRAMGTVTSPVGRLRVQPDQLAGMQQMLARVEPGQSLYVYPYLPVLYFVTQAKNPSRFAFMCPGMMTVREESQVLAEIEARPPEWVMYLQLSREEFLRVFPSATSLDHRFRRLERWLESNYEPVSDPAVDIMGYRLCRRASKAREAAHTHCPSARSLTTWLLPSNGSGVARRSPVVPIVF